MSNLWPVEGFARPSLGFHCSVNSLHIDNLSFIDTKLAYEIMLTMWLKVPDG